MEAGTYFDVALMAVVVSKADAPRREKLNELERAVLVGILAAYGGAVEKVRAAAVRYLLDRGRPDLSAADVTNLLTIARRELGPDGGWLPFSQPVAAELARTVYAAVRAAGDGTWEPDARDAAVLTALDHEQRSGLEHFYDRHLAEPLSAALRAAPTGAAALDALDEQLPPGESRVEPGKTARAAALLTLLLAVGRVRADAYAVLARLAAADGAGTARYRLRAVLDEVTTATCRHLDGRVFLVSDAVPVLESYARGDHRAGLWITYDELLLLGAGEDRADPASQAPLAAAGVALPPFHGNCRTEVEPA